MPSMRTKNFVAIALLALMTAGCYVEDKTPSTVIHEDKTPDTTIIHEDKKPDVVVTPPTSGGGGGTTVTTGGGN